MDSNTPASTASDAALLGHIREVAVQSAELAACLAQRGTRIAVTADPSQTTLVDFAAMGRSVADQARATNAAILLLTTPATSPAAQPATTDTVKRLRHADEWTTMLKHQIKTAIEIHALICAELSDRAAVAEECNAEQNQQLRRRSPCAARTLATHAPILQTQCRARLVACPVLGLTQVTLSRFGLLLKSSELIVICDGSQFTASQVKRHAQKFLLIGLVMVNTVIYFSEPIRDALHTRLAAGLRSGGALIVGSTERVADAAGLGLTSLSCYVSAPASSV